MRIPYFCRKRIRKRIRRIVKLLFTLLKPRALFLDFIFSRFYRKFVFWSIKQSTSSYASDYQDYIVLFVEHQLRKTSVNTRLSRISNTFLEIGAHDGIRKSNCYSLENTGWKGMCVEPNPSVLSKLKANRNCHVIPYAVALVSNEVVFAVNSSNTSRSYVVDFGRPARLEDEHTTIKVKSISTQALIKKFQGLFKQAPFYLSIDVEGMDYMILQAFLMQSFFPAIISVEHNFEKNSKLSLSHLFAVYGYTPIFRRLTRNDYVAVRDDILNLISN